MLYQDLIVVPQSGVNHFFTLPVPFEDVRPDGWVSTLEFVICRFADVMKQSTAASQGAIEADHFSHHRTEERNFNAVAQDVLAVAGSEVESAEKFNEFGVNMMQIDLLYGLSAFADNQFLNFLVGILDDLLNSGRMNPSIVD